MNREQYIELRNSGNIDFELFYEYYKIHAKNPLCSNQEEFNQMFQMFIEVFPGINVDKVFEHFDKEFNVTKVINIKDSKIVKYI